MDDPIWRGVQAGRSNPGFLEPLLLSLQTIILNWGYGTKYENENFTIRFCLDQVISWPCFVVSLFKTDELIFIALLGGGSFCRIRGPFLDFVMSSRGKKWQRFSATFYLRRCEREKKKKEEEGKSKVEMHKCFLSLADLVLQVLWTVTRRDLL